MSAFGALAQPTRLATFETLVAHAPQGLSAGKLAELIGVPQNTLSWHLVILERDAGIIHGERQGRTIIYRARIERLQAILEHFMLHCCEGQPALCATTCELENNICGL